MERRLTNIPIRLAHLSTNTNTFGKYDTNNVDTRDTGKGVGEGSNSLDRISFITCGYDGDTAYQIRSIEALSRHPTETCIIQQQSIMQALTTMLAMISHSDKHAGGNISHHPDIFRLLIHSTLVHTRSPFLLPLGSCFFAILLPIGFVVALVTLVHC